MSNPTPPSAVTPAEPLEPRPGLDLEAIRARAMAATEGPWHWWEARLDHDALPALVNRSHASNADWYASEGVICGFGHTETYYPSAGTPPNDADAEFIAHARTDIPLLIAEVERLRNQYSALARASQITGEAFDEAEAEVERLRAHPGGE